MNSNTNGTLWTDIPDTGIEGIKHKVPVKREGRLLIEVDVTPTNGTVIAGQHVPQGTHQMLIYKSELPDVIANKVAQPEHLAGWASAEKVFARIEKDYLDRTCGKLTDLNKHNDEFMAYRKAEAAKFGETSVAREFCKMFPRGMPPVKSLTVIKDVDAPTTIENQTDQKIEKLLTGIMGKTQTEDKVKSLEAQIAKLMDLVEKKGK